MTLALYCSLLPGVCIHWHFCQEKIAKLSEDGKEQDAPSQEPEGSKTPEADSSGDEAESNNQEVEPGKRKKRTAKKRYCVCRSTDDSGFMICCDKCGEWYHGRCIGLQPAKVRRFMLLRRAAIPGLSFLL